MICRLTSSIGIGFPFATGACEMYDGLLGFPGGHPATFEQETSSLRLGAPIANAIPGPLGRACRLVAMLPRCPQMPAGTRLHEAATGHVPVHGIGG